MIKKFKYEIMLIGCAAFWGLAFPVMKFVGESIDSVSFLAIRFLLATAVLAIALGPKLKRITKKMLLPSVGVGLILALHSYLQVEGLKYTSAANSGFITSTNVIFVPLFMFLFFRKKPARHILIGLAAIIAGFIFISGIVTVFPFSFNLTAFNFGDFLTLLCAIFTAIYMIVFNFLSAKYEEELVNFLHMGGACIGMWAIWLFIPNKAMDFSSVGAVLGTVYCGVFASAAAFLLLAKATAKLEASKVAILCSLEPIFATLFAFIFFGDSITLTTAIGGILILFGVLYSSIERKIKNQGNDICNDLSKEQQNAEI